MSGFTIVEMLVVVLIAGTMAAIAVPYFTRLTEAARHNAIRPGGQPMEGALLQYLQDNDEDATPRHGHRGLGQELGA